MIAFGPIPSRRLGQSLGINHIPPKSCSYDCIYCQVGRTLLHETEREAFYAPEEVLTAVREKVAQVQANGGHIDYLSFVPDGEPTLDINLGRMIELLRPLGLKIAVITNSSLLWRADVRDELAKADCVSLKMDAVTPGPWRRVNRPNKSLSLEKLLEGAMAFAGQFKGRLLTDTMLIGGVNDAAADLRQTAGFIAKLRPAVAYLALPNRPPLEPWAKAPGEQQLIEAFQIYSEYLNTVELLAGYAAGPFAAAGGDIAQNLLDITSVHPLRESEVQGLFDRSGADWSVLQGLIADGKMIRVLHEGQVFYARKLPAADKS